LSSTSKAIWCGRSGAAAVTSFDVSTSRGSSFSAISRRTCDLDDTALGIVISLIDQLHATRQELAAMARAIDAVPADLRGQLLAGMKRR
jgi:hypothetical protein